MVKTTRRSFYSRSTSAAILTLALATLAPAQTSPLTTEVVIGNFPPIGENRAGSNPLVGVIGDGAGNLYGATYFGGPLNYGVVYKMNSSGETVLHSLMGKVDGAYPTGALIRDAAGNLYGTCESGGRLEDGVVFRLDPTGKETVLHVFTGAPDGSDPEGGVIGDGTGNLYGTTSHGGEFNLGAVFKIDATGQETILYSFQTSPDGEHPTGDLIRSQAGIFYGATYSGGTSNLGVVFKLDALGQETILHSFTGIDGANPNGVTGDDQGNLYGAASGGATNFGVVYKLDSLGALTILYTFTGGADGGNPLAGLIRDAAGNLYGTTLEGGDGNAGVAYRINAAGQETVLYSFTGGDDGGQPVGSLNLDAAGNLYGTAENGGKYGGGVIFKLTPVAAAP